MINRSCVFFCMALWAIPVPVFAHGDLTGMALFYDGLFHPIFEPAHVLLPIALGVLLGQQGLRNVRMAPVWFMLSWLAAVVIRGLVPMATVFESSLLGASNGALLLLGGAALAGFLVVLGMILGRMLCVVIVVFAGCGLGLDSVQSFDFGSDSTLTLLGRGMALLILLLCPMGVVGYFTQKHWQKIGVKIAGSWITACAMLVLVVLFSVRA